MNPLHALARVAAQVLASTVLQGLLRLRTSGVVTSAIGIALRTAEIVVDVAVEIRIVDVAIDVGVAVPVRRAAVHVEPVVHIDVVVPVHVDVDVVRVPVEAAPQRVGNGHTGAECEAGRETGRNRIAGRRRHIHGRVGGIGPCAVDDSWVICRHIHDLWIGRHDLNRALLDHDFLLRARLQIACCLRLFAQALHGVHHIVRLAEKGRAELRDPVGFRRHCREDLRESDQRLHARIPWLGCDCLYGVVALQLRVRFRPCGRGLYILRESGGHQHLREQGVGIERDGCSQRIELLGRHLRGALRIDHARHSQTDEEWRARKSGANKQHTRTVCSGSFHDEILPAELDARSQ
jgi:hypothetical protein